MDAFQLGGAIEPSRLTGPQSQYSFPRSGSEWPTSLPLGQLSALYWMETP